MMSGNYLSEEPGYEILSERVRETADNVQQFVCKACLETAAVFAVKRTREDRRRSR